MSEMVTWLLPVKNAMPYLTETLASIAAQTYPHWRVFAWDNGSTDGSAAELNRWIPRILPGVVVADKAMGLGACLARMVRQSTTPLCARIDADDVNLPERLEKQVAFMQSHPDVAVLGTNVQLIDRAGQEMPGAWSAYCDDAEIRWRLRFSNALNHPTVMFRKSVVMAVGSYRDYIPSEDYGLWVRVAKVAAMANLPDRLVRYRLHPTSIGATHREKVVGVHQRIFEWNASSLFPGTTFDQAARLRQLILHSDDPDVAMSDCVRFYQSAGLAARLVGKPASYFRRTTQFRTQMRSLVYRWIKSRPGAATAWPMLRRSYRLWSGTPQPTEVCREAA